MSDTQRLRCLLVHAHPLDKSLTRHFLEITRSQLASAGHAVETLDLYPDAFDPRLTATERTSYYATAYDQAGIERSAQELQRAELLVLVFPTWWFGLPAMLKGWIDRVFAPGIAFDHGKDFGPIKPRLNNLRHIIAITTLGSPWWVDVLVMRRPVRRILKTAIFGACAPQAKFSYLPFYAAENPANERVNSFCGRIGASLNLR